YVLSRALLWLTAALLFLAVTGFLILRTSLPVTEGSLELAGLAAPVTVTRDADGIPHISAGSAEDAYRALGFVHAQHPLWPLDQRVCRRGERLPGVPQRRAAARVSAAQPPAGTVPARGRARLGQDDGLGPGRQLEL